MVTAFQITNIHYFDVKSGHVLNDVTLLKKNDRHMCKHLRKSPRNKKALKKAKATKTDKENGNFYLSRAVNFLEYTQDEQICQNI